MPRRGCVTDGGFGGVTTIGIAQAPRDRSRLVLVLEFQSMTSINPPPSAADKTSATRNYLCRCGSGLKFKHCCGTASTGPERNQTAAAPRPSLGPVTEAGRLLASFSRLEQSMQQRQRSPNGARTSPEGELRRTRSAQAHLDLAARHEAIWLLSDWTPFAGHGNLRFTTPGLGVVARQCGLVPISSRISLPAGVLF